MPSFRNALLALGLVFGLVVPLKADVRPKGIITALEIDENGMPIVKVRLSSKKPGVPDREFRFIFDTGAGLNVIDAALPADYFWEEPAKPKGGNDTVGDSTGQRIATRIVCLKRMEFAGMVRDDLTAFRMDLKNTMLGRIQDEPVDGILGMNFLRGPRFVIDPMAQEIRWWQDIPGHPIPLAFSGSGFTLAVEIGGTDVPCLLDTGVNGGIQVSGNVGQSDAAEPFLYAGASGEIRVGKMVEMTRMGSGGKAWVKVPLAVGAPGECGAAIGRDILWAAPLGLDFIDHWATFTLDAQGNLPYRKTPSRPSLLWERRLEGNRLRVGPTNLTGRWAKAGVKEGDEVLAIGTLEGKALNLRSVMALFKEGAAHTWRVRREGAELLLNIPAGD